MIDWTSLKPACSAWLRAATGLSQVLWENDAQGALNPQHARIAFVGSDPIGVDIVKETYNADEDQIEREVIGTRIVTLLFAVESFSMSPDRWAPHYAERARARLRMPAAITLLRAAGGALVDVGPVVGADYEEDEDRMVSRAQFTVRISVPFVEVDTAGTSAGSFIEHVELTSDVDDVDGDLDPDLQFDHEVIP